VKLRNHYIFLCIPLLLLFAIASQTVSTALLQNELKANLGRQLSMIADFIQQRTQSALRGVAVDLQILGSDAAFVDVLNFRKYSLKEEEQIKSKEIRAILEKIISFRPSYLRIYLVDFRNRSQSLEVFSDAEVKRKYGLHRAPPFKIQHRLSKYQIEITEPFYSSVLNDHILTARTILIHNSVEIGAIVVDVSLSRLLNELTRFNFIAGAKVFISDQSGHHINTDLPEKTKSVKEPKWVQSNPVRIPEMNWTLQLTGTLEDINALQRALNQNLLPLLFLILIIALIALSVISRKISQPAEEIVRLLNENEGKGDGSQALSQSKLKKASYEFQRIASALDDLFVRMKTYHDESIRLAHFESKSKIAQQIAHDVRSPLAALNMATSETYHLPEAERVLIRSAIHRINDIVNSLLSQYKKEKASSPTVQINPDATLSLSLISGVIDSIVSEKRLQFRSQMGLEISTLFSEDSYGLFAKINESVLKRVISNLINNSVESLDGEGLIQIKLTSSDRKIQIRIEDNGRGIPATILSRLGQRGETHGKAEGHGLGLFHAKTSVENWGGAFGITSTENLGTHIELTIPQVESPAWFVPELVLGTRSQIVIVDDDVSIHQIWDRRYEEYDLGKHQIQLKHFSTPQEFMNWFNSTAGQIDLQSTRFLIDQEFLGHSHSGTSLIQTLGIEDRSFLVTSHFEDAPTLKKCEDLKIGLIPKMLASLVPIRVIAATH